ncbi:MAG: hypothetical protein OEY06_10365 [Gammaproteobacteria bacterium]|nr:hypothetical protein [Gammaproteobacteria bacterium]
MSIFAPLRDRINSMLSNISRRADSIITKFYRVHFVFVCLLAIIGYGLVLLFPILAILSATNIYEIILEGDAIDWQGAGIWMLVLVLSSLLSYRISRIKLDPPVGLTVAEEKLPEIVKLVQQYQAHFKQLDIQRIVITTNYELDIVKIPKFALPIWSMNTMVIGLPVLLCLSPGQFECMVARRIGQFSKRTNPITNWIYQLRSIWKQYYFAYSKQKNPDSYILKWLYAAYASIYTSASVYAARKDELNADSYAMELFTHEDVREMITADATYQWYLKERYWPAINKIASIKSKPALTPYHNITAAILTNFKEDKIKSLTNKVFKTETHRKSPYPTMLQRLENVGHDSPYLPENTGEVAAAKYLGESQKSVVNLIDTLWLKDNMESHKRSKKK